MKFRKFALLLILALYGVIPACSVPAIQTQNTALPTTLTVYAASSLTDVFQELGKAYMQARPETRVEFNFAGSQELRTQLEQGARADIVATADTATMDALQQAKLIQNAPRVFARNQLIVIIPSNNPAGLERAEDLTRQGLKMVVAADNVPLGKYTRALVENLSHDAGFGPEFPDTFYGNVVSQETNARQVLSKIVLGEADAGIVYATDAASAGDKVKFLPLVRGLNVTADYPIALLKNAPQPAQAKQFIDFIISADGQAILKKANFILP